MTDANLTIVYSCTPMQGRDKMIVLTRIGGLLHWDCTSQSLGYLHSDLSVKQIKLLQTGKGREGLPVPRTSALY